MQIIPQFFPFVVLEIELRASPTQARFGRVRDMEMHGGEGEVDGG